MPTGTTVVEAFKAAGTAFGQMFRSAGTAAKEVAVGSGRAVRAADEFAKGRLASAEGQYGKAIKGIAADFPVSSTLAAAGLTYGGYKAAKAVFGPATERLKREREERDNGRPR